MAKLIPIDPRIVLQSGIATIKNIIDGIVELVTNSDDSYRRLEQDGKKISGEILIYVNRKKGGICEKLIVEDFAEGMTKEEVEKAIEFAGETSGFKTGKSVRGFFGRGLKETIFALGEGEIKTIKNGKLCITKLWLDKKTRQPLYDDELLNNTKNTSQRNGTTITITITNEKINKIPSYEEFKTKLSKHYALRDINSSENRKIILTYEDLAPRKKLAKILSGSKYTTPIKFEYINGNKVIDNKELIIPNYNDKMKLTIYETTEPLDSPRNNPFGLAGILIKTKSAILDNYLFRFENEPEALYFWGEVICEDLENRLRKGETGIISFDRDGLDWKREYCKSLACEIEKVLEPLILKKKGELIKEPIEVKPPIKNLMKEICNLLNEIAKKELEDEDFTEEELLPATILDLIIKPEFANIQLDKPRTFRIYAPADIVELEGDMVYITSDNIDIEIVDTKEVRLEKFTKYENIYYKDFKVIGKKESAEGTITVRLGESITNARVKVAPQKKRGEKRTLFPPRRGFISDIRPDETPDPHQRTFYENGIIKIYINFPSVSKFIKKGLEGIEKPEGKMLIAELVGEAFCKAIAIRKILSGKEFLIPGGEIDSYNTILNELQKRYLHKIYNIIFKSYVSITHDDEITPKEDYVLPILEVLNELGGKGNVKKIIPKIYEKIGNNLTKKDLEKLPSGVIRWENNVHWARNTMVDQGLLLHGSPRGIWEISDKGIEYLKKRI